MFGDNLITLRKLHNLTQEELAEKLGVSRQTFSKWETGDSLPDIEMSTALAKLFDVTLDNLVCYEGGESGISIPPKGRHAFGVVKVGDKGQIVIPAKARKIFHICPGDSLVVLGDEKQGIGILKEEEFFKFVQAVRPLPEEGLKT